MLRSIFSLSFLLLISCSGSSGGGGGNGGDDGSSYFDGEITQNTTWSGTKKIGFVRVSNGATLTILPGTKLLFRSSRDYKNRNKGALEVHGGATIKAVGTAEKQIVFTSSDPSPINGDWGGIQIHDSNNSEFNYAIIEFAELGLTQMDSQIPVRNSIIRWNNSEGLYSERSKPTYENNTLYGNAYHEIALEQFNTDVVIKNNYFRDGWVGIHAENSEVTIQDNYFHDYVLSYAITSGMASTLVVKDNRFRSNWADGDGKVIMTPPDVTLNETGSQIESDDSNIPAFPYPLSEEKPLDYRPGDEALDRFPYVYDTEDSTRKIVKRIGGGKELYFGWALAFQGGYLWRFSLGGSKIGGVGLDFIRIDPETGDILTFKTNNIMNPRGLTYDGSSFYVNDFSHKKIFKFKPPAVLVDGEEIISEGSFDIPNAVDGGTMGLTYAEGSKSPDPSKGHLYLIDRAHTMVYKIDPAVGCPTDDACPKIHFKDQHGNAAHIGHDLTWDGEFFWGSNSGRGYGKFDKTGKLVGSIYPAALDAWAITFGEQSGKNYLWTLQRTCELWDDAKIFQIEIKMPML